MKKGTTSPRKGRKFPRRGVVDARERKSYRPSLGVFAEAGRFFFRGGTQRVGVQHFSV